MLSLANRTTYRTLLDAETLSGEEGGLPAIIYLETGQDPVTVSRRQFRQNVLAYAAGLLDLGVSPGDLLIIAHTQNLESIYAFWGAVLAGAVPSMLPTLTEKLDPAIYLENLSELVRLSQVRAVLTTDEFAAAVEGQLACSVVGSQQLGTYATTGSFTATIHEPKADEIAFLQHSSGTTGLQKGVALTHQATLNQLASYSEAIALNEGDVIVSWLPLYHDMGLIAGFLLPLVQGIPLVLMSPFDWAKHPALLLRAIHAYQGTLSWLPNFAYNHCARRIRRHDTEDLSLQSMRMFINCSEPVYHQSHQLFLDRFANQGLVPEMLAVSYAMAENTFAVTQTQPGQEATLDVIDRNTLAQDNIAQPAPAGKDASEIRVSCGRPIVGTEVRVVDDHGNTLEERRVGELSVRSDCMLSEYFRRPELQPFQDGWYLTGDRGYIADGEVYVVGRSRDMIINAGKNIFPRDIETIVNQVNGIHPGRSVVFGVPDEREGTELIAVVAEVDTDDLEEKKQIARTIRQAIVQQSMVTATYVHLVESKWLIKTSSGKVARAANREKWRKERATVNNQQSTNNN